MNEQMIPAIDDRRVGTGAPARVDRTGLGSGEARERLARYGPNVVRPRGRHSVVVEYLLHFRNPLVLLLIGASFVLATTGEATSAAIILVIVAASVTLD